ncbi:MAG: hypothetical protein NT069_02520 [Planctomycetota bacterium]|nr:hypothetical protein [Planctomycetota bacterium]
MTPRASQAQSQNRLTERVNRVLNREVVVVLGIETESSRDRQVAGRCHPFGVAVGGNLSSQNISRDLFPQEFVVRLVGVEGIDDVVAVAPREWHGIVCGLSRGVGVTHHVEPVPTPALAVGGRFQQTVNDGGERLRRFVGKKRVVLC